MVAARFLEPPTMRGLFLIGVGMNKPKLEIMGIYVHAYWCKRRKGYFVRTSLEHGGTTEVYAKDRKAAQHAYDVATQFRHCGLRVAK